MTTTPTHPTLPASGEEASLSVQLEVSPRRLDDPDSLDFRTTPLRVVAVTERDIPLRILKMLKRDQRPWDSNPVLYAISRPNPQQPTSYRATPLRLQSLPSGTKFHPIPRLLGLSVVDDENILGVCLVVETWACADEPSALGSARDARRAMYVPKPGVGDSIEAAEHVRGSSPDHLSGEDGDVGSAFGWTALVANRIVGRYPLADEPAPLRSPTILRDMFQFEVPLAHLGTRIAASPPREGVRLLDPQLESWLTTEGVTGLLQDFREGPWFEEWIQRFDGEFTVADLEGFPECAVDIAVDIPLSADLWRWLGVHAGAMFLETCSSHRLGGLTQARLRAVAFGLQALVLCARVDALHDDELLWQQLKDAVRDDDEEDPWVGALAESGKVMLARCEGFWSAATSTGDRRHGLDLGSLQPRHMETLSAFWSTDGEVSSDLLATVPESVRHLLPALRQWVSDRQSEDWMWVMSRYLR